MHTCAVVVPVYRPLTDPAEMLSLEQTLETLANYPVYLVGPASLQVYFDQLRAELNARLQNITFADQYFASIEGYNDLLLSKKFYQAFDAFEYLLIVPNGLVIPILLKFH